MNVVRDGKKMIMESDLPRMESFKISLILLLGNMGSMQPITQLIKQKAICDFGAIISLRAHVFLLSLGLKTNVI